MYTIHSSTTALQSVLSQTGATTVALDLSLPAKSSTNSKFQSAVQWGCNDLRRNDDAPWPDHIAPAWTHKLVSKSTSSTNSRARGVGHDIGRRSEPESRDCRGIAAHLATHLGLAAQLESVFAAHVLVRSPSSCRLSETLSHRRSGKGTHLAGKLESIADVVSLHCGACGNDGQQVRGL